MTRGLFVTGTDTGVGKTVVAAALLHRYRSQFPLRYWKPIQTGIEQDDDTAEAARLGKCPEEELFTEGVRLPRPVSPHLAAALSGSTIALQPLLELPGREGGGRRWIVEGAGGVLVPINDDNVMADLISGLGMPAVVVARTALGTINHTLLTIEALRRREAPIAGVVLVGPRDPGARAAIERYGHVVVAGEMPVFSPLTPEALAGWATELDPAGQLAPALA